MRTRKTAAGTKSQVTAFMADLRSIVRLDSDNFNSFSFCFVLDKTLQLMETPVANPIVHSLSSACFPYSFKVLHHNLVAAESGNDIFTDIMVYPLHPTSFSSGEFLEQPLTGTSAFSLKFGTQIFEFPFSAFDFGGIIKPVAACDSKVIYSQVNTENSILRSVANEFNLFGESEQKESSAFFIHSQEAFTCLPREVFFIAFRDIEFEFLPFVEQTQNKNVSFEVSASWEIVSDRSAIDGWLGFSLFVHPAGLFDASNSKLRRQGLPQCFINEGVELDIIPDIILPCSINTELQSFAVSFDSVNYFRSGRNLDFSCCNTLHKDAKSVKVFKYGAGVWQVASGGKKGNHSKLWDIKPIQK